MRILLASVYLHFCALSSEPVGGFWPNLHRCIVGRVERVDLDLIFKVTWSYKDCKNQPFWHTIFWTGVWILTKLADKFLGGRKRLLDFSDRDLNFKVTPQGVKFDSPAHIS